MTRGLHLPSIDYSEFTLSVEHGGTGVEKLTKAASSIGLITESDKGTIGGVVALDANGKVIRSLLPANAVSWVNVQGVFRILAGSTVNFTISDYDSFREYVVACSNGTISRIGDIVTYVANAVLGNHSFTINGRSFDFVIQLPAPDKPSILAPTLNASVVSTSYNLTSSVFSEFGDLATHQSSDWQIATHSSFNNVVFSTSNDSVNKTTWLATGLVDGTTYFARVRYRATNTNSSEWSDAVQFSIAVPVPVKPSITFPTVNQTGVATAPNVTSNAFGALSDGSSHASSDWQIATDVGFTNVVKNSMSDAVNKTTWTPSGLAIVTDHYVRVRHRSSNGKVSSWSDSVRFTTTNAFVNSSVVAADTLNYNVRDVAIAAGWNQSDPLQMNITVNSGVTIGSATTGSYSFDTGSNLPAGSILTLVNNGHIVGRGGNGNGGSGGPGLRAQYALSVTNNGTIGGGGGAGGKGGSIYMQWTVQSEDGTYTATAAFAGGGGGGGAGLSLSSGGPFTEPQGGNGAFYYNYASNGAAGTKTTGGGGGAATYGNAGGPNSYFVGGGGGSGGALGSGGSPGALGYTAGENFGTAAYPNAVQPTAGGIAGQAVVGDSFITWQSLGTVLGARV